MFDRSRYGSAVVHVPEPGRYRVNWTLSRGSAAQRRSASVSAEPATVTVLDRTGEQSWTATLKPEQVAKARADL